MIQPAKTPGLGLPWPESWNALVAHYGSVRAAGKAVDISPSAADRYNQGKTTPRLKSVRERFLKIGWTKAELPPSYTPGATRESYYGSEADRARKALFDMIWRRNSQMSPAERFLHALDESSGAEIRNPEALQQWLALRDERHPQWQGVRHGKR